MTWCPYTNRSDSIEIGGFEYVESIETDLFDIDIPIDISGQSKNSN